MITTAVFLVTAVGFTRIALGVHHISDVVAGWLLGAAWLVVTARAFRLWHGDPRTGVREIRSGPSPESDDQLRPATGEQGVPAHPWRIAAGLGVAWVMVLGILYGAGLLVTRVLTGSVLLAADEAVVRWFAGQRRPVLDPIATVGSKIGNTHWILAATPGRGGPHRCTAPTSTSGDLPRHGDGRRGDALPTGLRRRGTTVLGRAPSLDLAGSLLWAAGWTTAC